MAVTTAIWHRCWHYVLQTGGASRPGFIPGKAGVDYPDFKNIPVTDFTCENFILPGFYADTFTSCQVCCSTRIPSPPVRYEVLTRTPSPSARYGILRGFLSYFVTAWANAHKPPARERILRRHLLILSALGFYADIFSSCLRWDSTMTSSHPVCSGILGWHLLILSALGFYAGIFSSCLLWDSTLTSSHPVCSGILHWHLLILSALGFYADIFSSCLLWDFTLTSSHPVCSGILRWHLLILSALGFYADIFSSCLLWDFTLTSSHPVCSGILRWHLLILSALGFYADIFSSCLLWDSTRISMILYVVRYLHIAPFFGLFANISALLSDMHALVPLHSIK